MQGENSLVGQRRIEPTEIHRLKGQTNSIIEEYCVLIRARKGKEHDNY